jgi:hypothetical protein
MDTHQTYSFTGSYNDIENATPIPQDRPPNSNKIYLGKFIEYIGVPYVTDWLPQGKARFENGIISQGYYDKIIPDPYKI